MVETKLTESDMERMVKHAAPSTEPAPKYVNPPVTASTLLVRHGAVLLCTRGKDCKGAGKLDLPGGFLEPKESLEQCAQRELYEETKLLFPLVNFRYMTSIPTQYVDGRFVLACYFVNEIQEYVDPQQTDEVSGYQWVEEVPPPEKMFNPADHAALAAYLHTTQLRK